MAIKKLTEQDLEEKEIRGLMTKWRSINPENKTSDKELRYYAINTLLFDKNRVIEIDNQIKKQDFYKQ